MKIKTDNYECSICRKRNVKLWRPSVDSVPLICAECAEERQSPRRYREKVWFKVGEGHFSPKYTGKKIPLPEWEVNEEGKIPTDVGPVPEGEPLPMTNELLVDISGVSPIYSSGRTPMVPACPDEEGDFLCHTSMPEKNYKWWEELPTR